MRSIVLFHFLLCITYYIFTHFIIVQMGSTSYRVHGILSY
jgi:hypothetical protein